MHVPAVALDAAFVSSASFVTVTMLSQATPAVHVFSAQTGEDDTPTHSPATVCPSGQPGGHGVGGDDSSLLPHAHKPSAARTRNEALEESAVMAGPSGRRQLSEA